MAMQLWRTHAACTYTSHQGRSVAPFHCTSCQTKSQHTDVWFLVKTLPEGAWRRGQSEGCCTQLSSALPRCREPNAQLWCCTHLLFSWLFTQYPKAHPHHVVTIASSTPKATPAIRLVTSACAGSGVILQAQKQFSTGGKEDGCVDQQVPDSSHQPGHVLANPSSQGFGHLNHSFLQLPRPLSDHLTQHVTNSNTLVENL